MAFQDFWRGGRERSDRDRDREQEMRSPQDPRDFGRPNPIGDEQGFVRRGWREGSDYYGNNPETYSNRGYGSARWRGDEFTGREPYRGADEEWRDRSRGYRGEFAAPRHRTSFNDRWENAYGPGFRSYGRSRFETGDEDDALRGHDREEGRLWSDRAGWPSSAAAETAAGQFRGRGPRGYRRSDERIREDVCERLTDDDSVDATNIDVAVKDGEVTLTGTVSSRDQKRRAVEVIEWLAGVKDVHSTLRIAEPPQNQQTSAPTARQEQTVPGARH